MIVVGGFGSHQDEMGPLHGSQDAWRAYAAKAFPGDSDPPVRVWRVECSNSYAEDDLCAPEVTRTIARLEAEHPTAHVPRYVLWGYSKGGNTVLQALGESPELRDATLAVLTMGSPLAGATALELEPAAVKRALEQGLPAVPAALAALRDVAPVGLLLSEASGDSMAAMRVSDVAAQAEVLLRTAATLSSDARAEFNATWLTSHDFSRASGVPIPFFQVAGAADLPLLQPLPQLTIKDGAIATEAGAHTLDDVRLLAASPLLRDHPLYDGIVALEHAVLPKSVVPPGLRTELLALLAIDHLRMKLHGEPSSDWDAPVPQLELVDALLDAMATKITR
jgi:hypothetical protein